MEEEEEEEEEVMVVDEVVKGEEDSPPLPESIARSTDLEGEVGGPQDGPQDGLQDSPQDGPQLHPHCSVTSKLLRSAPAIAPTADTAAEREEEEEDDHDDAGGQHTHCQRDPQCTRGYKHRGHCTNAAKTAARWAARLPKGDPPVDGAAAEEEGSSRAFACPDCGTRFGTHQGLGGHRKGCLMRSSMAERAMPPPPQQQQQQPSSSASGSSTGSRGLLCSKGCGHSFG